MTSKAQHTPGPWYSKNSAGDHQGLIIEEATGKTVALTYDTKDASLVAAAPKLLAALTALVSRVEAGNPPAWLASVYYHDAKDAIAEAKG